MKKPITLFILLFILSIGQMWGDTWTIAGSDAAIVNGSSTWDATNTANDMTNVSGNWWGLLVENTTLEAKNTDENHYEFKVFINHVTNSTSYPESNYWWKNSRVGTCNIIYSFLNDGDHNLLPVPFNGWRAIGHSTVFGTSWGTTDTNNDMTKSGDWEYTLTKKNVHLAASTNYGFKVINDDNSVSYPASDWNINVGAAGVYDVTITFNIVSKAISVTTSLKPSLVGEFNSWDVYANPFIDGKTSVELSSNTAFLVRYGGTDYKNNGTVSTSVCWTFFTDQGNCNLNVSEAGSGTYKFGWDHDTKQLTVIIPNDVSKSTLSKGKYIYFNDRHNSPGEVWKGDPWSDYSVRLALKDYATLDSVAKVDCNRSNVIEDSIFYFLISEIDDIGQVKIWRMNKEMSTFWDWSGEAKAIDRTSASQNCLSKKDDQLDYWRNWTPQWSTYCPIKKTCTISDNGTVTYGGNGTESTPFLVEKGTKVKVSATSTDYIEDANMTTKYNFYKDSQSQQNGEGTTYEFTASASAGITHQINVNGYNYYNETASSNQFSTLLYYQTVTCHTVTYNANGGTGSLPAASGSKYVAGTNVTLATNAGGDAGSLERDGYVFIGWNTAANGSGTHYDAGATLTGIGDNVLLYAHWVALTTPTVTPTTTNWAGSDIDITLTATSTYLAEPVVVFYVNDGTNTYEVMGAPYGSDGNSLGTIGASGSNYSTVHKATFAATTYGTYTVTAKLYNGKFIDNFEGSASAWSGLGYGTCERVSNVEREADNGSTKVMKITRSVEKDHGEARETAWTTTEEESGTKTSWGHEYGYIHMRYYAPQEENPEVEYWDDGISVFRNTTLRSQTANTWHELVFAVVGGVVNYIHPFVLSGGKTDGHYIYIDDVVLSNEESMTVKVTTASVSTTIYSLTAVNVSPTDPADYYGEPITISLSANSTGLQNAFVVFLVNDGTTTFEVLGKPETPGGEPLYYTVHNASFTTSTVGNYTVTAKLYEGKLIDNFDGSMAHWKALEDGSFNASATNPAMQAGNGSSTVMQITRGTTDAWKTVQTCTTADGNPTTNWNLNYGYIYMSMYSTSARTPKLKYSDDGSGYEVTLDANSLSANTWQRKQFATTHDIDYILPFMPAEGTMYIDDIILSNESSMTAKATSQGAAASFRIKDNKYYFTGNNKSSTVWNNVDNWNRGEVPSSTSEVFILAPVEIATGTTVHVDKVNIVTGGSITPPNGSSMTASGHLTIAPNAGLNVTGKIRKIADGAALDTRIATTPADLVLESSSAGNASLIFENDANQATVQMYSKASISGDTWNWQYVGTPFTGSIPLYNYYGSWMYKWYNGGWEVVHGGDELTPFAGYCLTQESATTHVMGGTLVPTTSKEVTMAANTDMVLANSWTAPISIASFDIEGDDATFTSTPATIYLFNTGSAEDGASAYDPEKSEAGTYIAVPINSAPYTGNGLIAPMQGFFVTTNGGKAGTITMNYDALVRPSGSHTDIVAGPMKARKQDVNKPNVMKIHANGTQYNDRVVILAREDFSEGFDNGWDGEKLSFGAEAPSVYVINEQGGYDAVSAIPGFEGTLVGFRAGTNNSCTMTFEYDGEEIWYLNDLQTQQSTLIDSELTYTFSTSSYDNEARFIISATPIRKITTGNESVGAEAAKVRKLIINDKLYIIRGGRMYSVDGAMIK